MHEICLQNRGLRSRSLKLGFGAEIQDLHRTPPHTGVGRQKKRQKTWWRQCRCAKASYKQHGPKTRLPRKQTTPKEDDQEYLFTSPNGESAPLSSLKTY